MKLTAALPKQRDFRLRRQTADYLKLNCAEAEAWGEGRQFLQSRKSGISTPLQHAEEYPGEGE